MAKFYFLFSTYCFMIAQCTSNTVVDASLNTITLEKQFSEWLSGPKNVRLLYSLTRDGTSSSIFHSRCDNKGPTITVIYNPHGSIYGGYTAMSWQYSSGEYYRDRTAFLFSLQKSGTWNPQKFPVSDPDYAIYNHHSAGPVFGGGSYTDLYTLYGSMNPSGAQYTLHGINFGNAYSMSGQTDIHNDVNTITNMEVYSIFDGSQMQEKSWRKSQAWSDELLKNLTEEIQQYSPLTTVAIPRANILLIGPIRSGKSSFFNTINSIFRGYVSSQALTGTSEHSVTTKFRIYPVKSTEDSKPLNFQFHDTAGTEDSRNFEKDELEFFLNGNIPDGYKFNPAMKIVRTTPGFVTNSSLSTSVHCIAIVLDGSEFEQMSNRSLKKFQLLRKKMNEKGIPQVVLLTKIDKVCDRVHRNITRVFNSEAIGKLVDRVATVVGLPRSHVLPVKNYEKEHELSRDINILALLSLRQMLRYSNDHMFNFLDTCDDAKKDDHTEQEEVRSTRKAGRRKARPKASTNITMT